MGSSNTSIAEQRRFWQRHVAQWSQSGQKVKVYCRAAGICPKQFTAWRQRLRREGWQPPVDLRKSIDGLSLLVGQVLGQDPFSAQLFVFVNRRRDKLKALRWDHNGFVLYYKRLERGTVSVAGDRRRAARAGDRAAPVTVVIVGAGDRATPGLAGGASNRDRLMLH